jgi:hypothetical protein
MRICHCAAVTQGVCGGLSQAIARGQVAIWTPSRQNRWLGFDASIRQHFQSPKQTVPLPSLFVRHCYPRPATWPLTYVLPLYYGTCLYNPPSQLVHALVVTVMVPSQLISSVHGVLLQQIYIVDSKRKCHLAVGSFILVA